MKTGTMRLHLLAIMTAVFPFAVPAQFTYVTNGGAITITKYTGMGGAVTIPGAIFGRPVTSIGDGAFSMTSPTSVAIPSSVTNIGDSAFENCNQLSGLSLPSGLKSIGARAFAGCGQIPTFAVPDSVLSVGDGAFSGCHALFSITLGTNVPNIGDSAFFMCSALADITIPNSVTNIGDHAFEMCDSLISISIPNKVARIGFMAFSSCFDLNSISVSDSVTSIGRSAFYACENLTSVTMGSSITSIEDEAFSSCQNLPAIAIGNAVTNIGIGVFSGCNNLQSISVGATNPVYSSLDGVLFDKNQSVLIQYPLGRTGGYTIPEGVTSVASSAFQSCGGLSAVTIPNSLTNIGDWAFADCAGLTALYFQGNAPAIGVDVFVGDNSATVFYLAGATGWGVAFGGRPTALWDPLPFTYTIDNSTITITRYLGGGGPVTIPNTINGLPVALIGANTFSDTLVTSLTIPSNVVGIAVSAFDYTGLTELAVDAQNPVYSSVGGVLFNKSQSTLVRCPEGKVGNYAIPNSVTRVGDSAFANCFDLTSVSIPNGVTSLGVQSFHDCISLTNIVIPDNVTSIGEGAFTLCIDLDAIQVGALNGSYTSLDGVLYNKLLTRLIQCPGGKRGSHSIPDTVTTIGDEAFEYCSRLTNIWIGSSVSTIGNSAFLFCDTLASFTIPDSVTSIGVTAFSACSNLTNVTLGKGVTNIGTWAFSYCSNLAGVYFPSTPPTIGTSIFLGNVRTTVYCLPGIAGWGATFGGRPTALWKPRVLTGDGNFGVRTNRYGFNIAWASGMTVVVDACTNLVNPTWIPLRTNTLAVDTLYFSDSRSPDYPRRFYRVRWP